MDWRIREDVTMITSPNEQTRPLVSVVIPTHNRGHLIQRAVTSAIRQTYHNLEVIVIDDGSSDNTADHVAALQQSDERIRYLRQERSRGAQAARNAGIRDARGEYVAFLDSDDEWLPDRLRLGVEALAEMKFDNDVVVHSDCLILEEPKGAQRLWTLPLVEGETGYRSVLSKPGPMFQGLLVAKTQLQSVGWLDEGVPSYQEWDTAILLAKRCRLRHLRTPLFVYHKHQGETISKDLARDVQGYEYVIRKHEEEIKAVCGLGVWQAHLRHQLHRALMYRCWDVATRCVRDLENLGCNVNCAVKAMVHLHIGTRHIAHLARGPHFVRKCVVSILRRPDSQRSV